MGPDCRAEGIWAGRNPYGFRYNLNHPWVRDRYLAYKRRLGLPEYVPLSDKQRRELEQQLDQCASCGWEAAEAARRREYMKEHGLTLCADGFRRLIIKKENNMATPYKECPLCGAHLDSAAGKELFNMKENKHGFEPKQEFTMGGIAWTVIQTGADWVKCIASDCVEERAFDEGNKNDFAASSLRAYLNGKFLRRLIKAGAPEEMFEYFNIDLTADDGLKNYGGDRVRIGLITCEEYRLLRGNIPALPDRWWWTATPDSPINSFVRGVYSVGALFYNTACIRGGGVRPLCNLKSEILVSYLNGENAEEQKKRAEAVDMMKHIAAAWDIDAEEVFGRADE